MEVKTVRRILIIIVLISTLILSFFACSNIPSDESGPGASALRAGQNVEIGYSGKVMES